MRLSTLPIATLKEAPADAEIVSHRLMLRAGLIRKLAAGLYTWLPMGLRVLRKIEQIVREEMNRAGAHEVLMPSVQPADLWRESGRWEEYGPELLRITDRHQREFCYGPTHEEVITDIARRDLRSYKELPVVYYQVQTKFRDEIRPRFGVMRAREFIMKDAYSFHLDDESLSATYDVMHATYTRIFTRLGLRFRAVRADSGAIGGNFSHEFHVLADSGEDTIVFCDEGDYAANIELAPAPCPQGTRPAPGATMESVATPGARTIDAVSEQLGVTPADCVKTLFVRAAEGQSHPVVALLVRGDHELNAIKAVELAEVAHPFELADPADVEAVAGCVPGFVGPVGLDCPVVADHSVLHCADFVCGANQPDTHLRGVNWERDLPIPRAADLRNVQVGEACPEGRGTLAIARGIEVGHIFQLGRKYSESMAATVLDANGRTVPMAMGCYGIGITRIAAAAIEQNHDDNGIIWPLPIAPFQVVIVPINMGRSARVREAATTLYEQLGANGYEVLLDDRDARPGVKFADCDLLGIPLRIVVAERGLDAGTYECKGRTDAEPELIAQAGLDEWLQDRMRDDP